MSRLSPEPDRRYSREEARAGAAISTVVVVNGPVALDPPGIAITLDEIGGAQT